MKRHSAYLNPFQPFQERELDGQDDRPAFEDNMSRSVFCALANADGPSALAVFLQQLTHHANSPCLRARIEALVVPLWTTEPAKVEFGLRSWPPACALQEAADRKILIGISSSHATEWTYNTRRAPDKPCADAWIYVPGQMLLVFECKNDSYPLDATQVSAYVCALGLVTEQDCVPRAKSGCHLDSVQAKVVQAKCKDQVLDLPWVAVIDALEKIRTDERTDDIGRWLSSQAAGYIRSHVRPSYRGVGTILEWLNGLDTPDRRDHLRILVGKMGDALAAAAKEPGAITFTKDGSGKWEVLPGVSATVYVRLCEDGQPVQRQWLGKTSRLNLWTVFNKDLDQPIGLDFWVEANGAQPNLRASNEVEAWNSASKRHADLAEQFEDAMATWVRNAPLGSRVDVNAVQFKGKSKMWKGGGQLAPDGRSLFMGTPQGALAFLKEKREALWRFPRVGSGGEVATIEEAQPLVRKPALALRPPLDVRALAECGDDAHKLQAVLKKAVANVTDHALS